MTPSYHNAAPRYHGNMTLATRGPQSYPKTLVRSHAHPDTASPAWPRSGRVGPAVPPRAACARLLACVSVFLTPAARAQDEYRPEGADWSITVPQGWQVAPPSELESLNQAARAKTKDVPAFVPRYVLRLDRQSPRHRYVLVQQQPGLPPGTSFEQLAAGMADRMQSIADQSAHQLGLTPPRLDVSNDPERQRIFITGRPTLPSGAHVGYLGVVAFGARQQFSIHAYADSDDFDAALPELRAIADSFRFDPGAEYVFAAESATPPNTPPAAPSSGPATSRAENALLNVAFVVSAAAVLVLVMWLLKRRKTE